MHDIHSALRIKLSHAYGMQLIQTGRLKRTQFLQDSAVRPDIRMCQVQNFQATPFPEQKSNDAPSARTVLPRPSHQIRIFTRPTYRPIMILIGFRNVR